MLDLLLCAEGVPADQLGGNDSRGEGMATVVFGGFICGLFNTIKAVLPAKTVGEAEPECECLPFKANKTLITFSTRGCVGPMGV